MAASTRIELMAAAEGILVEQGVNALSVRKIGDAAKLHPTLVTYHFGTLVALLDELCTLNLEPIQAGWQIIEPGNANGLSVHEILHAWLRPMLEPAMFTPGGRALVVLDELAAHGEPALQARLLGAMEEFAGRLRSALAPLVPGLGERELRSRLRFISGAALGPPPRVRRMQAPNAPAAPDDLRYLLPFAMAALGVSETR